MNERIKSIRLDLGLTQAEFGERLCLSQNYVWMVEKGDRFPSDRTVADICRVFNVNEDWLRTGEGEKYIRFSRRDTIAAYLGKLNGGKCSPLEEKLIEFMAETSAEEWEELAKILKRFSETMQEPDVE